MQLNQKCSISRGTKTKNDYKQITTTWDVVNSKAKCNIQQYSINRAALALAETGLKNTAEYIGFFDATEDILANDKINWYGMDLFVIKPFPVFAGGDTVHHKEALLSLEAT